MHRFPRLQQFQGCLLGLAVADALGAPWEGMTAGLIFDMGPADAIVEHRSGETIYYTDDTEMAIGVVELLIEHGVVEVDALAERFAGNYHPDRGYGQGARKIINAIGRGEDWKAITQTIFDGEGSLGNGAAMRVAPLGVFFAHDLVIVSREAEASALPTHVHPIGIDAARLLAIAAAIASRSAGKAFNRRSFLETLLSFARTDEFRWQLDHALQLEPYQSLAAMSGALAGARLGIEGIPRKLIDCLEDSAKGRTYLFELAQRMFDALPKHDECP